MLTGLALTFCAISGLSCSDEDLTAPHAAQPAVSVNTLITSDTLCARVQFSITSATAVTTVFPNRTTCTTKLVLIRGQAATWAQSPNRRLTLFVRLLNKSGQTLQLPVRLYLPSTGIRVVAPAGTPASKVVPLTPDSVEAGGGKIWFIGGTGTLAANDSTVQDTIKVNVMSPVTQARFQFTATANTASAGGPVPALPPDSTAAWVLADSSIDTTGFTKNLLVVLFQSTATQADRQAAISMVGGVVVGGLPMTTGDGYYLVQIADSGAGLQLDSAVVRLKQLPTVVDAGREWRGTGASYLRPIDGINWARNDWRLNPDSAVGDNWALEDIAAPMAWGCSTGDTTARVAVLDHAFQASEIASNTSVGATLLGKYPNDPALHGTIVSNILAARGNDGSGMTGVMWRAGLHLQEFGGAHPSPERIGKEIQKAGQAGVKIVSLSYNWTIPWGAYVPTGLAQDTAFVWKNLAKMMRYLRMSEQAGKLPLIVVSAGNDPVDAFLTGYPALKDSFPTSVIVTGASTKPPHARWTNASTGKGSSTGPRIDIYAPGDGVYTYGPGGYGPGSGTSESAPLVAGVAGLLLSFDPRLTAIELKVLIDSGAVLGGRLIPRGGSVATSAPLLNTYESLKLAAERPGAPLCGNRVWPEGDLVRVQRGTTTDTVRDAGTPVLNVTTMHGGKRLLYTTGTGSGAMQYQNGAWVLAASLPSDTMFNGVTSHLSHDGDSIATVCCSDGGPLTVEIGAVGAPPAHTYTVPVAGRSSQFVCELEFNGVCQQSFDAGAEFSPYPIDDNFGYAASIQYSSRGDEVYLSVPTFQQNILIKQPAVSCPFIFPPNPAFQCFPITIGWAVTSTTVYAIDIRTGARRTVETLAGAGIWQVGVNESNTQMTSLRANYHYAYTRTFWTGTSGGPYGNFVGCAWEFTPINGATSPAARSFPLPAGSNCTGSSYRGTFAPIRAALRR
ncbi:MAG: S8 family serine peptidase [Gemmatimonadota bacterium]|nr:S8 family serine peptidase [Gemmatimonadota bacterium]